MNARSRCPGELVAGLVAGAAWLVATVAQAEPVDPALPTVVTVGSPKTPAPTERLDRERRGRSTVLLPARFVESQRKSVGAIGHAPVVHPDGTITVALTSPELLRLGADGTEVGRVALGSAAAVRAPVILPNGSLAVLTGAPSVVFVSATGKVSATIALPRAAFGVQSAAMGFVEGMASIVPTEDGAVAVAANRSLLEVDASSRVRLKVTLPERLASDVLPHQGGWLAVGESGSVYRIKPPAEPRKIGSIGTLVPGTAALLDDRTVIAQSPPNRLIALDLKSGAAVTRVGDSIFSFFDAPPAFDAKGSAWLTTGEGFLVGYDAAGTEISRAPADRAAALPGTAFATFPPGRGPHAHMQNTGPRTPTVVDHAGRVAFARNNGRFGVRDEKGQITSTDRACSTPLAIVPLADRKAVLACRDGTLVFFEENAKEADAPAP